MLYPARQVHRTLRSRLNSLSAREREVLDHVLAGRLNKQIASDLGVVEKTIKVHRARVMEKLGTETLPDLIRVAALVGISPRVGFAKDTLRCEVECRRTVAEAVFPI